MKKYTFKFIAYLFLIVSCSTKNEDNIPMGTEGASDINLPYTARYSTEFTNNVPDSSLLLVLNSYKYWENGNLKGLRSTMGDSMSVDGSNGFRFRGHTDSLMNYWLNSRDSLNSVVITMDVWLKNHSVKDSIDYINVWYKEVDTYKDGRVDSANYEDDNGLKNGKIIWYSSHKQKL